MKMKMEPRLEGDGSQAKKMVDTIHLRKEAGDLQTGAQEVIDETLYETVMEEAEGDKARFDAAIKEFEKELETQCPVQWAQYKSGSNLN